MNALQAAINLDAAADAAEAALKELDAFLAAGIGKGWADFEIFADSLCADVADAYRNLLSCAVEAGKHQCVIDKIASQLAIYEAMSDCAA